LGPQSKGSKAAAKGTINSLSWAHSMAGMPSPTAGPFVWAGLKNLWPSQALRRTLHSTYGKINY